MDEHNLPDTSHLRAGMTCTVRFRGPYDWNAVTEPITEPVTGVLEDTDGTLYLGISPIRDRSGTTSCMVAEVIDPAPPKKWPVGTRLTNGTHCAILAKIDDDCGDTIWFAYSGLRFDDCLWLTDDEVADWTPVEDERVTIDLSEFTTAELRNFYEFGEVRTDSGKNIHYLATHVFDDAVFAELNRRGEDPTVAH